MMANETSIAIFGLGHVARLQAGTGRAPSSRRHV